MSKVPWFVGLGIVDAVGSRHDAISSAVDKIAQHLGAYPEGGAGVGGSL